jgi:hypothetical protein
MLKTGFFAALAFSIVQTVAAAPAPGCTCLATYPVCSEVAQSDVIFIGTVESIEPAFLDPWNPSRLSLLPSDEIMRLQREGTPASLAQLKQIYLKLYPNMPPRYREDIEKARSHEELRKTFDSITSQGKQARLRVKTVFSHKDDDKKTDKADTDKKDKDADDDDDNLTGKIVTVWTDSGGCGYNFQKGETYLVYADNDEETGQLTTSICHRTSRLSDAGSDLAYLYYFKNAGTASTRLEGAANFDSSPLPDAVIELKSVKPPGLPARYTRAGPDGTFVFDGLTAGDYELSVYDQHFPQTIQQLGFPKSFHAESKSCSREILNVPKY